MGKEELYESYELGEATPVTLERWSVWARFVLSQQHMASYTGANSGDVFLLPVPMKGSEETR